jgi:hypothetical protein
MGLLPPGQLHAAVGAILLEGEDLLMKPRRDARLRGTAWR